MTKEPSREDEVLLRMLKTKPKPHEAMKGKKKPSPDKDKAKRAVK
jgi:hypothetical protein